jgi:hypothetical protein
MITSFSSRNGLKPSAKVSTTTALRSNGVVKGALTPMLRRFFRYMPARDVLYFIIRPFLGKSTGATKAEALSRAVEHGEVKDAAAALTQLSDVRLEHVLEESRLERLRIQREAEAPRDPASAAR